MRRTALAAIAAALTLFLCLGARAEEKPKPGPKTITGELMKIEDSTLTVTRRGDKGVKTETFTLGAKTKILIETDQDETVKVKREGGDKAITRPKVAEGKTADLKTGQRVTVVYGDDRLVTQVTMHRPAKPRKKEGDK